MKKPYKASDLAIDLTLAGACFLSSAIALSAINRPGDWVSVIVAVILGGGALRIWFKRHFGK